MREDSTLQKQPPDGGGPPALAEARSSVDKKAVFRPRYHRLEEGRLGVMELKPGVAGGLRVTCFPFAGGGPLAFAALAAELPESWAVHAIDPPGHVRTAGEVLWTVEEMVAFYLRALPRDLLEGALLVGHSLGGYVGFGLAQALEAGGTPARGLVIGAAQPLHRRDPALPLTHMSDEELYRWVSSLGGLPTDADASREFFDIFREAIRADCTAFEAFRIPARPLERTPVLGLSGTSDPIYPSEWMSEWSAQARRLTVDTVEGAHLFVMTQAAAVAAKISKFAEGYQP